MCGLTKNNILIMAFMFYGASITAQNHQDWQVSVRIFSNKERLISSLPCAKINQHSTESQIRCVSLTLTLPINCERSS